MSVEADVAAAAAAVAVRDVAALAAMARSGSDLNLLTLPTSEGPRSLLEAVLATGDSGFVAAVLAIPEVSATQALPAHGFWRWAQGAPLAVVQAFLDGAGVDPARTDADGMTLLHEIASVGAPPDVVRWLLERVPADPHAQDGSTPLAHALGRGDLALAEEFRRHGADVDAPTTWTGWTPLITAVAAGESDVVTWLLACDDIDVNRGDATGATALQHASRLGRMDAIEALMRRADLDLRARDGQGRTALMDAARHGRLDVVTALLRHPDPGVDLVDSTGRTALQHAVDAGVASVVDALQARSALPATAVPATVSSPAMEAGHETQTGPIEAAIGDPPMEE